MPGRRPREDDVGEQFTGSQSRLARPDEEVLQRQAPRPAGTGDFHLRAQTRSRPGAESEAGEPLPRLPPTVPIVCTWVVLKAAHASASAG